VLVSGTKQLMDSLLQIFFVLLVIFFPLLGNVQILKAARFRPHEFFGGLCLPFPICTSTLATVGFFSYSILQGLIGAIIIYKLQASPAFIMLFFLWALTNVLDIYGNSQLFEEGDPAQRRLDRRFHAKRLFVLELFKFLISLALTGTLYQVAISLTPFLSFIIMYKLWTLFVSGWILFLVLSRRR
jgi:hypothetical protein